MSDGIDDPGADPPEESREEHLRRNTSYAPESKEDESDEGNPMHPDSWSGGSINKSAKAVAAGDAPANQESGGENPPRNTPPPLSSEVTRPWAPEPYTQEIPSDVDASGKPTAGDDEEEEVQARQAPDTTSPQDGEPSGARPEITKGG